jgi:hypothetical protein
MGLVTAALLAAASGINWHGLATSYHLYRLNRDPDRLAVLLRAPAGSPQRSAVRAFLIRTEGRAAFLGFLLDQFPEARTILATSAGERAAGRTVSPASLAGTARAEVLSAAWELLDLLAEEELALPGEASLRYVLVRWVGGTQQKLIPGYWSGYVLEPPIPGPRYWCQVRKEGGVRLAASSRPRPPGSD